MEVEGRGQTGEGAIKGSLHRKSEERLKWQLVKDREHLTNPVVILLVTHSDRTNIK